jgi:hypothetical protein
LALSKLAYFGEYHQIIIFDQIKTELLEKGKNLIPTNETLCDKINSGRLDPNEQTTRNVGFKIVCTEMLYDKQHQYIDEALTKLNDMRDSYLSKPTTPNKPQPQPQQSEQSKTSKQTIKVDELGVYFISTFRGMVNGSINNFQRMIDELNTKRTGKEFAQIALMIYESDKMSKRKPKSFAKWHKLFCEYVGCKYVEYDPNKLRTPEKSLKTVFDFLY